MNPPVQPAETASTSATSPNAANEPAQARPESLRARVLLVLEAHRTGHMFAEDLLERRLDPAVPEARDRALAREMTLGVVRHRATLDAIAAAFSSRPLTEIHPAVLDALRLGLYQIVFLDRIPPFAAVGETVEALKIRGPSEAARAAGFVNGILRAVLRDTTGRSETCRDPRRDIPAGPGKWVGFRKTILPPPQKEAEYLAAAHSYPKELVARWVRNLGRERAEAALAAGNRTPPIILRANRRRTDRDALITRLVSDGFAARPGWMPGTVVLDRPGRSLLETPAFVEGLATAQDATAVGVGLFVAPQPGEKVLDLCASPGGKATHLAELMDDNGLVLACDVSEEKLEPIRSSGERLGLTCLRTVRAEVLDEAAAERGPFDRALADVPCSNTGVLSRRAEARWRFRPDDLRELALQQLALLKQAARHVRPGGLLVYSTCSVEPEENDRVVDAFLDAVPGFKLLDRQSTLPDAGSEPTTWRDGGFRARLLREPSAGEPAAPVVVVPKVPEAE
jgi:16S rRNA (cytosine967-C5)-methyltransferase